MIKFEVRLAGQAEESPQTASMFISLIQRVADEIVVEMIDKSALQFSRVPLTVTTWDEGEYPRKLPRVAFHDRRNGAYIAIDDTKTATIESGQEQPWGRALAAGPALLQLLANLLDELDDQRGSPGENETARRDAKAYLANIEV